MGHDKLASEARHSKVQGFDDVSSWVIGVTLLLSGVPHFGNPYYFLGSVYAYDLVNPGLGQLVAMVLPVLQLVLAVCLVTRLMRDGAHLIVLLMLVGFAALQTTAKLRGLDISCGCFGSSEETIGWFSLSVIYGLLILSLARNAICILTIRAQYVAQPDVQA